MTTSTTAQAGGSPGAAGPAAARAAGAAGQGRLTVLRAARLFDGISAALIADPVVVLQGSAIVSVGSGARAGRRSRRDGSHRPLGRG